MKMVDKSSSKFDKYTANMIGAGGGCGSGAVGISGSLGGYNVGSGSAGGTSHHQNGHKPVPMKLFAAWEVDRTPPNCIPRLCSLTITRLSILTPLPGDLTSLSLAVKMQSSKRTLRSHEIPINPTGLLQTSTAGTTGSSALSSTAANVLQGNQSALSTICGGGVQGGGGGGGLSSGGVSSALTSISLQGTTGNVPLSETELDLHFSLQYPHFIKRDGNRLVILLQRRKKYKSRTILGYKTLAEGIIRMDAVLQKSMDMTVELTASGKNGRPGTTVACLRAERVSSIPVDHDNKNNNSVLLADRLAEYSDEDEEGEFSSGEFNDEANDLGIGGYDTKRDYNPTKHDMRKYRKLQRSEVEDAAIGSHPVDSDSEFEMKDKNSSRAKISRTISLQQRNFKQKIAALLKRFKASEELEGETIRGPAALRSDRELDALFQELESMSCCEGDDSGPDMDSLSIGSTPKPSLRPFFTNSRIMLHDSCGGGGGNDVAGSVGNIERRSSDKSDQLTNSSFNTENNKQKCIHLTNNNNNYSATTPDRSGDYRNDSSGNEGANAGNTDGQTSDPQNSPPRADKDYIRGGGGHHHHQQLTPVNSSVNLGMGSAGMASGGNNASATTTAASNEKRSRLFRTSSNTPIVGSGKKKQTLSLAADPRSVLESCLSPTNVEPRRSLLDQLSRAFAGDDAIVPDEVTIISPPEALGNSTTMPKLTALLANTFKPSFMPQNTAEVKAVLQALMGKIQKYCNSNAKPPNTVKILLIGSDWLQGCALRHYVELMGVRPPDWLNHLRFYIVPMGNCPSSIARYLSQIDQNYSAMFGMENWQQLCERAAVTANAVSAVTTINASALSNALGDSVGANKSEILEVVQRIQRYLHAAGPCTQIPIAEAMVNYKDEDSCQIFVPFISDVRIGYLEGPQASLDLEEGGNAQATSAAHHNTNASNATNIPSGGGGSSSPGIHHGIGSLSMATSGVGSSGTQASVGHSGSPPQSGRTSPPIPTPPSSASSVRERGGDGFGNLPPLPAESVELQVDYWPIIRPGDYQAKEKGVMRSGDASGKNSIKSTFRNLQVWRLPQNAQIGEIPNGLTVSFATKEKKQKQIMRLGKKKDRDLEKEQCVEGVARLICSPKQSHPVPLRVCIDGTEWTGVKFFQLSSQWQTHVKSFPVALIGCAPLPTSELS